MQHTKPLFPVYSKTCMIDSAEQAEACVLIAGP